MRPVRFAAFVLAAASAAVVFADVFADAGDDKLAELKALEKDDAKCVAKIEELKDSADPKVVAAIRDLAKSKSDKIAVAATKAAANRRPADLEFEKILLAKLDDKDLFDAKDGRPEVYLATIEAVGAPPYRESVDAITAVKKAQGGIERLLHKFAPIRSDYASRLASVWGMVLERPTLEGLLKTAESLDSTGYGGKGSAGGDAKKAMGETKTAVLHVMATMTGQELPDAVAWRKWWNEKGKTFVFPAPGAAPPAAAAPSKIEAASAEYKDDVYGFSCRKPEDSWWTWTKPDFDAARVMLVCRDPADPNPRTQSALAYFIVHDAAAGAPFDVKSFAQWVVNVAFKDQVSFDAQHAPTTETQKQAGVEWTVVRVRGEGLGTRKGWGTHERRVYIAQMGTRILWVDACIRLDANPDEQTALWHSLDSMTVPPPEKKK